MNEIKVVWMDDQVKTYRAVMSASADEYGQLVLSLQGVRPVHIPLCNVRWWGKPGSEVKW